MLPRSKYQSECVNTQPRQTEFDNCSFNHDDSSKVLQAAPSAIYSIKLHLIHVFGIKTQPIFVIRLFRQIRFLAQTRVYVKR